MKLARIYFGAPFNSTIEIDSLNLFIGQNGSGKSTLLERTSVLFGNDPSKGMRSNHNIRGTHIEDRATTRRERSREPMHVHIKPDWSVFEPEVPIDPDTAFFILEKGSDGVAGKGLSIEAILNALFPEFKNDGGVQGISIEKWHSLRESFHFKTSLGIGLHHCTLDPVGLIAGLAKSEEKWAWLHATLLASEYIYGATGSNGSGVLYLKLDHSAETEQFLSNVSNNQDTPSENIRRFRHWNEQILVPLLSFSENYEIQAVMKCSNLSDAVDQRDLERTILELAAHIGNEINEHWYTPQVDWLYRNGEGAQAEMQRFVSRLNDNESWFKVHPAVEAACRYVETYVNQNLPTFVSEKFDFFLRPISPVEWIGNERIKYGLANKPVVKEFSNKAEKAAFEAFASVTPKPQLMFPLESFGAGICRWVNLVLSLAIDAETECLVDYSRLVAHCFEGKGWGELSFEEVTNLEDGPDDPELIWTIWTHFCETPKGHLLVDFSSRELPRVILVDEPEANLHPNALHSVRDWLANAAALYGAVFVATHNLSIFDTQYVATSRFLMGSDPLLSGIEKLQIDPSFIDDFRLEMGFSPGELAIQTKRWLFVEGEVDRIVIETFFSDILKKNGVRVVSLRGSQNTNNLMQLDLLSTFARDFSILLDKDAPDAQEVDVESLKQKVEKGFLKKDLSKNQEVRLAVATHDEFDIMFFLDGDLIREALASRGVRGYRQFPRMTSAWSIFEERNKTGQTHPQSSRPYRLTVKDFKAFLQHEYGLMISPSLVREVTEKQARMKLVPQELQALIEQLCAPLAF
jgi:energy-coupling factor transporter ATP-binding protein EcfA2